MCTLVVSFQRSARFPLILAANRDEHLQRPSEGWARRTLGAEMVAPLDVKAGGTWMGVNRHHVVAALTNHHTGRPPDPALRTRGDLIGLSLQVRSAREAYAIIPSLRASAFNPFHLVVADASFGFLWHTDGDQDALVELQPGLHIVTESSATGTGPRGDFIRAHWNDDATIDQFHALMAHHDPVPQHAVCVHLGEIYGTRSSAILRLGPGSSTLHSADVRPCESPYRDHSALLAF